MQGSINPWIKVCCISSVKEASLAIECGASALGLVGPMPSGPGVIDDDLIKRIAASVSSGVSTFLLTSETDPEAIINHYKRVLTDTIQIVDDLEGNYFQMIRDVLPTVKLVQVIHVVNEH